jgi:hypothetical protein
VSCGSERSREEDRCREDKPSAHTDGTCHGTRSSLR